MSRFAQRKHGLQTGCLPKVTQLAGTEIHTQLCLTSDSIFLAVMLYCFGSSSCWEIFRHLWKQFCGNSDTVMVICFPFKTHNSMMYPGKAAAFARLQDSVSLSLSLSLPSAYLLPGLAPVLSVHSILCLRREGSRFPAHTWLSKAAFIWVSGVSPLLLLSVYTGSQKP